MLVAFYLQVVASALGPIATSMAMMCIPHGASPQSPTPARRARRRQLAVVPSLNRGGGGGGRKAIRGLHQSAPPSCSPSADIVLRLVLESPNSAAIAAAIAGLYALLGGDGNGASPLGACPAPSPGGKGWISAETDLEVVSTALAPDLTTAPVGTCDSDWAQQVWNVARSALGSQVRVLQGSGPLLLTVYITVPRDDLLTINSHTGTLTGQHLE